MAFLSKIFGDPNARSVRELSGFVEAINRIEEEFKKRSDLELKEISSEFRARLAKGETLDDILPEAFAAVREAAQRTLGQRHYDVQLFGGIVLHQGKISEMRTGEGKTLVATLPAYLNALSGRGVHVVTVNDYLSRRDAVWMGQIYHALGLTIGILNHEASYLYDASAKPEAEDRERDTVGAFKIVHDFLRPCTRREAYEADITYGTNNEYGFDYLRDNMAYAAEQMVQRPHHFAIVDEVDSILIDEARTPLIISAPDAESGELYRTFSGLVPRLVAPEDYTIDEKLKAVAITEAGIDKIEGMIGKKLYEGGHEGESIRLVHHLEQALRAHALFLRDRDYVVKDGEVIIVDEFTGRLMPGRRWSEGLHQAVEAKEGVVVQKESRTLATITFQNYFRLYEKLAGMTGTAATSAEEFHKVYKLDVVTIPTHRENVRRDEQDLIFRTERGKFQALAREVKRLYEAGAPVLIGTVSIEKNERLSEILKREGIPHEVLNAKNHEQEAAIIAQAGKPGRVTVATNLAGRGVDIILGGNPPDTDEAGRVREQSGLHVFGTERHEARRIDNQLRGRAGRQGDPGLTRFYLSLEDDLMRVFGSDRIKRLMETFGIPEDEPIENRMVSRAIESAQAKIEGFHFDARKHVLEFDDVMNKQREAIYRDRRMILLGTTEELDLRIREMLNRESEVLVDAHLAMEDPREAISQLKAILKSIIPAVASDADLALLDTGAEEGEARTSLVMAVTELFSKAYAAKESALGENFDRARRAALLQSTDFFWMEHLDQMDHLRDSVRLRAYGQRDPLVEYKNESIRLFRQLQEVIRQYAIQGLFRLGESGTRGQSENPEKNLIMTSAKDTEDKPMSRTYTPKQEPGRNDPCPCGSGLKYKKCGMINAPQHQK